METDYESDGEDAFMDSKGNEQKEVFSIGTVVFPVDKAQDFVDTESVLINHVDKYIGKCLGEALSEKVVGAALSGNPDSEYEGEFEGEGSMTGGTSKYWKVLGTFKDTKSQIPSWLWAVMKTEDYDAYMKEIIKCSVIIYDVTDDPTLERFDEIRAVCDALREKVTTFRTRRVFILISSVHSWSHTKSANTKSESYLSEADYRRRRTEPLYRDLQLLERYVVASGKMTRGMLKAYVIGAGAVYGAGECPLHHWFKSAWHNAKYLPIYGTGKNFMPTIYIKDLSSIVQCVMDATPKKQRYILAVDPVVYQQDQIVKGISNVLGTGRVKKLPLEEIYLNKELSAFQADQLLLDLKLESTFCKENFQIEFAGESGVGTLINKLASEYKKSRNLDPLKICILGPPSAGKSSISRQISDMYRLNHFTKEDMIKSTIEILREVAGEQSEPDIAGLNVETEDVAREVAKSLLSEIDASLGSSGGNDAAESENEGEEEADQPVRKDESLLSDEVVCKLYRYRLMTNQCQNQGFILDGFPCTYQQAQMLFIAGDDVGEVYGEEAGEDGKDPLDPRLVPDKVIILEAPDEYLTQRLLSVPMAQLQERHTDKIFPGVLAEYRERTNNYETTFLYYLDIQEMIYFPIDITSDGSPTNISTIGKISDLLGKPRNYGLTVEEEAALKNAQQIEQTTMAHIEKEDMAQVESKELDERRNNIQQWMEKLAKIKREEFEREEAALIPLRHYLMAHVVPTLTKGLVEVTRARPFDPVEFLAEFLFQHNPGSINNASAQKYKEDTTK